MAEGCDGATGGGGTGEVAAGFTGVSVRAVSGADAARGAALEAGRDTNCSSQALLERVRAGVRAWAEAGADVDELTAFVRGEEATVEVVFVDGVEGVA